MDATGLIVSHSSSPRRLRRRCDDIPWLPGHGLGLGFGILRDIDPDGRSGPTGEFHWAGSYHTMFWVDPAKKLTVVYMAQLHRPIGLDDLSRIRALIYGALE